MRYSLSNDTWDDKELNAIREVINSTRFTMGEYVKRYEAMFAGYFGAKYAVMSNSGSSANLLAVAALVYSGKLKRGDEVIVSAVSWSTTYFPLEQCGLKTRLVDIDINSLNIAVDKIEEAITADTKAVFAVNLLGNPNEFDKLCSLCRKYNLILIEDNCEAMGAEYNGKKTGTFGVLGTFSSYYSHHICTMEGGMTVTDDESLYHYMLAIRSHGWTRHLPDSSPIYKKDVRGFYESFQFIVPGYNLRPLEIEAAAGIEQLRKLNALVAQRRENAGYFTEKAKESCVFATQSENGMSSWFGFALLLKKEYRGRRDRFISALNNADIEVRPIVAGNFARQIAFKYMDASIAGTLENADYLHDNGFFVGNHSIDMREQIEYLFEVLARVD